LGGCAIPAYTPCHSPPLHAAPNWLVREQSSRSDQRILQGWRCDGRELKTGGHAVEESGFVRVNNGVRQSADPRNDRNRSIAQTVKLCKTTRLEARGHQNGIRATLQLMRERILHVAARNRSHPDWHWPLA
jgi:hypothetical protein